MKWTHTLFAPKSRVVAEIQRATRLSLIFLAIGICGALVIATFLSKLVEGKLSGQQREINKQRKSLISNSKMSSVSEMAGGVAHEINNLLAVIKMLASQLQEIVDEDPVDRTTLKSMSCDIEKTTDRITKIVAELRAFFRDGSNDTYESLSLKDLIQETASFCSQKFKNNGVISKSTRYYSIRILRLGELKFLRFYSIS